MKKKLLICITALVCLAALCAFGACNTEENPPSTETAYTVSFELDGGAIDEKDVSGGLRLEEGTVLQLSGYEPVKTGSVFTGWESGGTVYESGAQITVNSDITLTAQWSAAYFKVTFDLNGGEVAGMDLSEGVTVRYGTVINLIDYLPEKPHFDFGGWKAAESVVGYDGELTVASDIMLAAIWTAVPVYTVTFDANGGTLENTGTEAERGAVIEFADYIPQRENYDFTGWQLGGNIYKGGDTFTVIEDAAFVAQWKQSVTAAYNFLFELSADGQGYVLIGFKDDFAFENVIVPEQYNGLPVTEIGRQVFFGTDSNALGMIKNIDFGNCTSLVKIGDNNFYMMDVLETVNFAGCTALTEIGRACFRSCDNLVSVSLAGCSALKAIGSSCFAVDPKLTEIDLKGLSGLETIGSGSFSGYDNLNSPRNYIPVRELDFSDCVSLKSIGQMSFWYLSEVKALDFSKTRLTAVDRQVIMGCAKLEKVALPATLDPQAIANESLGINNLSEFIYECDGLKEITVDPLSIYLCAEDGVLYDIDKTTIFKFPANCEAAEYTAPSTVTKILSRAFVNALNLTVIDFGNCNLSEIAFQAFSGCSAATVTVPFDAYGYYQDGTQVTLGSNWNAGVKQMVYGERYLFFTHFVNGITDGRQVATENVTVTASATYGDSDCEIIVTVNGVPVEGNMNEYIIPLAVGVNKIVVKAECDGAEEQWEYSVTRTEQYLIKTDLSEELNMKSESFTFKVWAENVSGIKQDITGMKLSVAIDCGMSAGYWEPYTGISSDYDGAELTYTVTVNHETLLDAWYEVDGEYHIRIKLGTDEELCPPVIYSAVYVPTPVIVTSLSSTEVNSSADSAFSFTVQIKSNNRAQELAVKDVTVQIDCSDYGSGFGAEPNPINKAQTDGTTVTVTMNYDTLLMWFYNVDKQFNLKITVTLTTGEKIEAIYQMIYEG